MNSSLPESTRREIGQHFILGFHPSPTDPSIPPESITTLIKEYYVGAVILMKRNVPSTKHEGIRTLISRLQQLAKESGHERPLLIGTDQENGLVSAMSGAVTQFPGAMTLAAAGEGTYECYAATARQLKALGVNWAFAPVADVNSDSANPVIGVRSFGDDAEKVAQHVLQASRGLTDFGVASSPKHFPGHGDTSTDSHLSLPTISKTLPSLHSCELVPFKEVLKTAPSVMTAHILLPSLSPNDPASLSYEITTELLRGELGYEGVVVTDCLEMHAVEYPDGISARNPALRALKAGADIAMICHTYSKHLDALHSVYAAVSQDPSLLQTLKESGKRVAKMKDTFAPSWQGEEMKTQDEELAKRIYRKAITILQDEAQNLPLNKDTNILVLTPEIESLNKAVDDAEGVPREAEEGTLIDPISGAIRNTAGSSYLSLVSHLRATTHKVYPKSNASYTPGDEDTVIVVLRNAHLGRWQLDFLTDVLGKVGEGKKVVVLSSCAPYDLVGFTHPGKYTHVLTYEYTAAALEAAVDVMFGAGKAEGRVPVRL